jgi:LysM repeat protein
MINKFFTVLFLIAALLLSATVSPQSAYAQSSPEYHTVQSGETLFSIARDFELTVSELRRWNDLDSDELSTGQELRIAPPEGDNQTRHTVESGETLFSISRQYDVTIAELQQWNDLQGTNLETGRVLIIYRSDDTTAEREDLPEPSDTVDTSADQPRERESIVRVREPVSSNTYYTVRSGDTLTRIAREHDMSVQELRQLNSLDNDMLSVGQRLTVHQSGSSAPSVAESAESSTPQGRFVQYRVESGEDGSSLLEKFQMSERELLSLNPGMELSDISSGQRITVLLPPTRSFDNPYRKGASLEDLGEVSVFRYRENDIASPTTSGELYNPDQLTAAHSNMALGNVVFIENPTNGKGIFVRINDRHSRDGLKLSHKAFDMLGFSSVEDARVTIYLDN